jgi:hypothetical protein
MPDRMTRNAMAPARRAGWMAALVALLLLASGAHAELHKCQDASGRVTYTDQACPSTSTSTATPAARAPKRVEVAPPPQTDLSGLPKDAQGRPILSRERRRDHRSGAARRTGPDQRAGGLLQHGHPVLQAGRT